jgi:8-oxo-dGTP pyrophosphatase MutT (NUDIX family)
VIKTSDNKLGMNKNTQNPWKTLSTNKVYQNSWITVREDQVLRPDGSPGIYGVVQCRVATGVVAIDNDTKVCLVGQYRYPLGEYSWEIPEGGAEPNESPILAAKRELKEETGVFADDWRPLGERIHLSNCHSDEVAYIYLATNLQIGISSPEPSERLSVIWKPLSEVMDMVSRGEITDALSIIGIMRATQEILR